MLERTREFLRGVFNPGSNLIMDNLIPGDNPFSTKNDKTGRQAYSSEPVRAAIKYINRSAAKVPFIVKPIEGKPDYKTGQRKIKNTDKDLAYYIDYMLNTRPNNNETPKAFFTESILQLLLTGNTYIYCNKDTKRMYLLDSEAVVVKVKDSDADNLKIEYHTYTTDSKLTLSNAASFDKKKKADRIYTNKEIIHVKEIDNINNLVGHSRIRDVAKLVQLYEWMLSFQRAFFSNSAMPGIILKGKDKNKLTDAQKAKLLKHWNETVGRMAEGFRGTVVVDGGIEVDRLTVSDFRELEFTQSIAEIRKEITNILGVPHVIQNSGNNANVTINRKMFYEETVMPIIETYCDAFAHFFDNRVTIMPDKFKISVLRPDLEGEGNYYSGLKNNGMISINEGREHLGFDRWPEEIADKLIQPQNIAGSAVDAKEGGRPDKDNEDKS